MADPIIGTSCCAIGAPDGQPVTDVVVTIKIVGGTAGAVATGRLTLINTQLPSTGLADTFLFIPVTLDELGQATINVNIPPPASGFKRCKGKFEIVETALSGALAEEFFVDSGVTYNGEPETVIGGLDHLIGETVSILADGVVVTPQIVDEDGQITLTTSARIVHAGLPYESIMQPMRIDSDPQLGNTMSQVQRIHKLIFRLIDTGSRIFLGATPDITPTPITLQVDSAGNLFDGDRVWDYSADYDRDATFVLRSEDPLPMTLLGVTVYRQVSDAS